MNENDLEVINDIKNEKVQTSKKRILGELFVYLILIFFAIFVVPRYVLQRTVVDGSSMENTLHHGESLLVEKVTKHFTDPKRYDIIIFDPPDSVEEKDVYYVKRIIGLPGETIQIKENSIYIDGKVIEDVHEKVPMDEFDNQTAASPLKLAEDEFFILGDNREVSKDSRDSELGPIKRDMLIGKPILRIWPWKKFGLID